MCSLVNPFTVFEVKDSRAEQAIAVVQRYRVGMTVEEFSFVLFELGWGDQVPFEADQVLSLNLTDMQWCALAAAMVASVESGMNRVDVR